MGWNEGIAWAAGGYVAGTLPSTWLVARARRATALIEASRRRSGETDPHVLMAKHLGARWTAVAATLDVLKGFVYVLVARHVGRVGDGWLAVAGVLLVVGHSFPFYLSEMAGRGLAATAGVLLALLPLEMTVCGVLIVVGAAIRNTSLASTIGLGSVPAVAAVQRQPGSLLAMGGAILGVVMIRRLEGIGDVVRSGVPLPRAVLYRCVFDSSGVPAHRR